MVLIFYAGHLCAPNSFAHFPPADSLYPAVRAIKTKARHGFTGSVQWTDNANTPSCVFGLLYFAVDGSNQTP